MYVVDSCKLKESCFQSHSNFRKVMNGTCTSMDVSCLAEERRRLTCRNSNSRTNENISTTTEDSRLPPLSLSVRSTRNDVIFNNSSQHSNSKAFSVGTSDGSRSRRVTSILNAGRAMRSAAICPSMLMVLFSEIFGLRQTTTTR